jgi:hypothetical protein
MFPSPVSGSAPNISQNALGSAAEAGAAAPSTNDQRLEPVGVRNVPRPLLGIAKHNGLSIPKRTAELSYDYAEQMKFESELQLGVFKHNALEARLKAARGLQVILNAAAPSSLAELTVSGSHLMLTDPGRQPVLLIEGFRTPGEQDSALSRFGLASPELDRLEEMPTLLDDLLGISSRHDVSDRELLGQKALAELKSNLQLVQLEFIPPLPRIDSPTEVRVPFTPEATDS